MHKYFDKRMRNRQRLLWAVATRRQLERWEPFVAAGISAEFGVGEAPDSAAIWTASVDHLVLVAARHPILALNLEPVSGVGNDPDMREELIAARDLHEQWDENMPVFNVTPRPTEPKFPSGKRYAKHSPSSTPGGRGVIRQLRC